MLLGKLPDRIADRSAVAQLDRDTIGTDRFGKVGKERRHLSQDEDDPVNPSVEVHQAQGRASHQIRVFRRGNENDDPSIRWEFPGIGWKTREHESP